MEEQMIRDRINYLQEEIKNLENEKISEVKREVVVEERNDSEYGILMHTENGVYVFKTAKEIEADKKAKEKEIVRLKEELYENLYKLKMIEDNKPEAILKRRKEEEERIQEERQMHENEYKNLNILVKCISVAGMEDLAMRLSKLRFAFETSKSEYVKDEIYIQNREHSFELERTTTKSEYSKIKRNVIRLTKEATYMAKQYKELYDLYSWGNHIIIDMAEKGLIDGEGNIKNEYEVSRYFNTPGDEKESNFGYECLEFYRTNNSNYNKAVDKKKI